MKKKINVERPNTCVIYVRVSSEDQVKNYSLGSQEKACREYAERQGWKVLEVFIEEGESAKNANRTQLQNMQQYCIKNTGKIGYLVVYKVDRFARDVSDHFAIKLILRKCDVVLRSTTELLDDTPQGKLSEGMLAVFAQFDNNVRTERTITGMTAKALKGCWPMGAPWGYKNAKDELEKKIIIPDPERAPIVKFIFEEYARGTVTFRELAKKVNAIGDVRSKHGQKMSQQLVHKILKNPIHYGWISIPKFDISV
jgi:site-specific DNA recombinase